MYPGSVPGRQIRGKAAGLEVLLGTLARSRFFVIAFL
jgi:hypothetical protein